MLKRYYVYYYIYYIMCYYGTWGKWRRQWCTMIPFPRYLQYFTPGVTLTIICYFISWLVYYNESIVIGGDMVEKITKPKLSQLVNISWTIYWNVGIDMKDMFKMEAVSILIPCYNSELSICVSVYLSHQRRPTWNEVSQ